MEQHPKQPLDATLESVEDTGQGSGLTGGPNPGEPGHDGERGDPADLGTTDYSPEMGNVVVERRDRDEP